jgi:hypothetical protein
VDQVTNQTTAELGNDCVADLMPKAGVELFEPVDIDNQQRSGARVSRGQRRCYLGERCVDRLLKGSPIGQAGQVVVGHIVFMLVKLGGQPNTEVDRAQCKAHKLRREPSDQRVNRHVGVAGQPQDADCFPIELQGKLIDWHNQGFVDGSKRSQRIGRPSAGTAVEEHNFSSGCAGRPARGTKDFERIGKMGGCNRTQLGKAFAEEPI